MLENKSAKCNQNIAPQSDSVQNNFFELHKVGNVSIKGLGEKKTYVQQIKLPTVKIKLGTSSMSV